jgi:hypothetical protein
MYTELCKTLTLKDQGSLPAGVFGGFSLFHCIVVFMVWFGLCPLFCSLTRAPVASEDSGVMISSLLHVHLSCRHSNFCIEGEGGDEQHGHSYHLPEFMTFSQ